METAPAANTAGDVKKDPVEDERKIEDVGEKQLSSDGELEANRIALDETHANRVLRKVDYRLVPMLALLYLVAFIDRSNSKLAHFHDKNYCDIDGKCSWKCQSRRLDDGPEHAWSPIQHCRNTLLRAIHPLGSA